MPPLILWTLGALGATVVAKWLAKEARRINTELDSIRTEPVGGDARGNLKRDPETGIYRPQ